MGKNLFLIILFVPLVGISQLKVAKIFSDNMVLQRDQPIHIWGIGSPQQTVVIRFSGQEQKTIIKKDSSWNIYFKKQGSNDRPQTVTITSGTEKIILKNILIGDIWLCIGQSNMEFPMKNEMHFKDESHLADQPLIRLYDPWFAGKYFGKSIFPDSVKRRMNTADFYEGHWQNCDSESVKEMSAVAYYFAKKIVENQNIPIGIINLAVGGAPLESFIGKETLERDKGFAVKLKGNWLTNEALPVWPRRRGMENFGYRTGENIDTIGPEHPFKPGFIYAAGIAAMTGFPVKGSLLYQGESNAQEIERVNEFGSLQSLMIDDYRKKWKESQMPFYWVQLSSMDTLNYRSQFWPEFRDEQRKLLAKIKYSGMAVSSDVGFIHNVHPTDKKTIGERLARWALNKTYEQNIIPSGPLPAKAIYKHGTIIVSFHYVAAGLTTSDKKYLRGFSLNGLREVDAVIKNKHVIITSSQKPEYIFYAWKPFTDANLVNSELLPASTFKIKVQ